jgi:hypothetical protein
MINPKIKAAIQASGMSHGHAIDCDIKADGSTDIVLEGTYSADMLEQLAAQMRLAEIHYRNATICEMVDTCVLPDHADKESVCLEAAEYMNSYKCDAATAVRDVLDAYHEGAADAADARRNGDWDYGRE